MLGNPSTLGGSARESQVNEQLSSLSSECERLHDRIDSLVSRLDPVLDKSNKTCEKEPVDAPECVIVQLASKIRTQANTVGDAVEKLERILKYLEL